MVTPNYNRAAGRLVTDRFDFQNHVEGTSFNHTAPGIQTSPPIIIDGYPYSTVQDTLYAISQLPALIIPDASLTTKGIIKLSGDIAGTGSLATDVRVSGLQGKPVSTLTPSTNQVLTWDGSVWKPLGINNLQAYPVSNTPPSTDNILMWDGSVWKPSLVTTLQGFSVSTSTPSINNVLTWSGFEWAPSLITTLQNNPVSATSPSTNDVLTWDGSTWLPSNIPLQFSPGGDLDPASTNIDQKVIGLTGLSGKVTSTADTIEFVSTIVPTITQASSSSNGYALYLTGQDSTLSTGKGGAVIISGGANNTTNGFSGGVLLKMKDVTGNYCMLDATELAAVPADPHRRVLSLLHNSDQVTNTEMPNGTGDMVIFVNNAVTNPTVNPVGGAILYADDGYLSVRQRDGENFRLTNANKIIYNNSSSVPFTSLSSYFNTTSASYQWVTDGYLNLSNSLLAGDIITIQYSSSISCALLDDGYIRFNVNHSGDHVVTGSEQHIFAHDGYAYPISISAQYIMPTSSSSTKIGVQIKRSSGAGSGISIYTGISLVVQIIRP